VSEIPTTETCLPEPMSPYGINKHSFEKYLDYYHQVYGQKYTALRFANLYGPRQFKGGEAGVIAIFTDNAVNGIESVVNGDGKQTRDFVYVSDVIDAFLLAMDSDYIGAVNIGTGKETNLLEIVSALEQALNEKIKYNHNSAMEGEQLRSCLDNSLAKKVLGWEPKIGLNEGIAKTIEWSKNK